MSSYKRLLGGNNNSFRFIHFEQYDSNRLVIYIIECMIFGLLRCFPSDANLILKKI